jgi:hypothetical protein
MTPGHPITVEILSITKSNLIAVLILNCEAQICFGLQERPSSISVASPMYSFSSESVTSRIDVNYNITFQEEENKQSLKQGHPRSIGHCLVIGVIMTRPDYVLAYGTVP